MQELQRELNKLKPVECIEAFNVFRTLRKESDEVQLHSRFIASLLDPSRDNPLGLGGRPLELFLKQIGSQFHVGPNTRLTPGWRPYDWSEDKEIDILIEDKKEGFAIIVENKIYASDSNHPDRGQLEGYHRYITGKDSETGKDSDKRDKTYMDKQVEVYYLTLDGHKPSAESLGTKEKGYLHVSDKHEPRSVKLIQYRKEICGWLNELLSLNEVSNRPYVTSAIEQYRNLVSELAGDIELHRKLAHLACQYPEEAWQMMQSSDENNLLVQKKKDVFWHGIVDFLNELELALKKVGFEIEPRTSPLYEAVTNLIFGNSKSDEIYFRILDKRGFVWTLQSNGHEKGRFFLGIDKETNLIQPDPTLRENEDNGWFCHIDLTPELYLTDMLTNKETFECIMVPNRRAEVISHYVCDIKTIINSLA